MRAITNNRYRVGDFRHFIEFVRDVNASHALLFEVLDQVDENPGF